MRLRFNASGPGSRLAGAATAAAGVPNLAGPPTAGVALAGGAETVAGMAGYGGAAGPVDDARTLSISWDDTGSRFKEFRSAVSESKCVEFSDWPIAGPRTVKHVIMQVRGRPSASLAGCLQVSADGWAGCGARILLQGFAYGDDVRRQLDVTNLAGVELVVRAI